MEMIPQIKPAIIDISKTFILMSGTLSFMSKMKPVTESKIEMMPITRRSFLLTIFQH